jgi:hypothetical protein
MYYFKVPYVQVREETIEGGLQAIDAVYSALPIMDIGTNWSLQYFKPEMRWSVLNNFLKHLYLLLLLLFFIFFNKIDVDISRFRPTSLPLLLVRANQTAIPLGSMIFPFLVMDGHHDNVHNLELPDYLEVLRRGLNELDPGA